MIRHEEPPGPEVTVVIPTRNRWSLLRSALDAVRLQRDIAIEAIVVDDGSSDETPERLASIDDPRIRSIRRIGGRGVAAARNEGIVAARGTWIAFLDDDDIWSPAKLRSQVDAADARGAVFAYASVALLNERLHAFDVSEAPDPTLLEARLRSYCAIPAGASNVIARREVVQQIGGFDEHLHQLADWDLWIRLASEGSGAACPEVLVGYRHHAVQMLRVETEDVFLELDYLDRKHGWRPSRHTGDYQRRLFWRWAARGSLNAGRPLRAARLAAAGEWRHHERESSLSGTLSLARVSASYLGRAVRRRLLPRDEGTAAVTPEWVRLYA